MMVKVEQNKKEKRWKNEPPTRHKVPSGSCWQESVISVCMIKHQQQPPPPPPRHSHRTVGLELPKNNVLTHVAKVHEEHEVEEEAKELCGAAAAAAGELEGASFPFYYSIIAIFLPMTCVAIIHLL